MNNIGIYKNQSFDGMNGGIESSNGVAAVKDIVVNGTRIYVCGFFDTAQIMISVVNVAYFDTVSKLWFPTAVSMNHTTSSCVALALSNLTGNLYLAG